jgi:PAS domain S-box-containing protein
MATGRAGERRPVNILLVDDTPAKLLTYEVMLAELGENLLKANSAEEAFEILLKRDVALVITDVGMPSVDGFEFARALREHPRFQATPIIFISAAFHSDPDLLKGYATGAVDYVTAPIAPELLRAKVRVFVELYRLRNDLEERVRVRTAELAESEARYRSLVQDANDIVATLDLNFCFTSVNPAVERILGYAPAEIVGTPLSNYVPPDQLQTHKAMLERKLTGQPSTQYEMQLLGKDREHIFVLEVNSKLLFDPAGRPIGIHSISRDITERKQAEGRQLILMRELQHRTKNLLAVVQSIATQTLANSSDVETANNTLIGRLHALARAQDFVGSGASAGISLRDLVAQELTEHAERIVIDGPPFVLSSAFAQGFALVIHELKTNAVKYGSLSARTGQVEIRWDVEQRDDDPRLLFSWTERRGPRVIQPRRRGFGSVLIAASLLVAPELTYDNEGLRFNAIIPLAEVVGNLSGLSPKASSSTGLLDDQRH